ncbi:hypothetical protein Mapa_014408 [Marchantia paleacea]|nr:hypothetical protein Mapa_014408 [Marchantia paleacea]
MMTANKPTAGRPKGLRFMVWVIGSVCVIMCIQLWVYERKWSEHHPDDPGTNTFKTQNSTLDDDGLEASDNPEVRVRVVDESSTLREILEAVSMCAADPGAEVQADTAECLEKLFMEYPALRTLQQAPRLEEESSHQRTSDKILIEALENQIANLSQMLQASTDFLELKDTREAGLSDGDRSWFMSAVRSSAAQRNGLPEMFEFPSALSNGRILCFLGNDSSDGTKNRYGLAFKGYLPRGATLLPGLTLVADNYWDYTNIWHGMSALVGFVSWRVAESCVRPSRLLLFHWGELVPSMGAWIDSVLHAAFGARLPVERLGQAAPGGPGPVCLERAVVNRRGLGGMSLPNMNAMFLAVRCRARKFCAVDVRGARVGSGIRLTLLIRSGARSLANVTAVTDILSDECRKVDLCQLEISSIADLSFCDQVALMSRTDVLLSTHGAQLTNMMFMSEGGYVMEMMPKGWLEFAGVGQYIYTWLAEWTRLKHEGIWRDTDGPDCPFDASETLKCFFFFKDIHVGLNHTHLALWTAQVLQKAQLNKQQQEAAAAGLNNTQIAAADAVGGGSCPCDHVDNLEHASHVDEEA